MSLVGEPLPEYTYRPVVSTEVRFAVGQWLIDNDKQEVSVQKDTCPICGQWRHYQADRTGNLFYNSRCKCTNGTVRPRPWLETAEWINRQTRGPHKENIMRRFFMNPIDYRNT